MHQKNPSVNILIEGFSVNENHNFFFLETTIKIQQVLRRKNVVEKKSKKRKPQLLIARTYNTDTMIEEVKIMFGTDAGVGLKKENHDKSFSESIIEMDRERS